VETPADPRSCKNFFFFFKKKNLLLAACWQITNDSRAGSRQAVWARQFAFEQFPAAEFKFK
jgi:hypothetical protein